MFPTDLKEKFDSRLRDYYGKSDSALTEAILYSLLGPGKRVRPHLVYWSALATGELNEADTFERALAGMMAVEMVHCYSLVHDDLPSMDDDDYRRGRLSCHKKYGEALAILVGDALIADAFDVLSRATNAAGEQVRELAAAIGSSGMVLGQYLDLSACNENAKWAQWQRIHSLKTSRLFECACVLGALSSNAKPEKVEGVREYARAFGLAFQLRDDLDDYSDTVSLLGQEEVKRLLNENVARAMELSRLLDSKGLFSAAEALLAT